MIQLQDRFRVHFREIVWWRNYRFHVENVKGKLYANGAQTGGNMWVHVMQMRNFKVLGESLSDWSWANQLRVNEEWSFESLNFPFPEISSTLMLVLKERKGWCHQPDPIVKTFSLSDDVRRQFAPNNKSHLTKNIKNLFKLICGDGDGSGITNFIFASSLCDCPSATRKTNCNLHLYSVFGHIGGRSETGP